MSEERRPTIAVLLGNTPTEYSNELINGFYVSALQEDVNLIFLMRSSMPKYEKDPIYDQVGVDYNAKFADIFEYVPYVKPDALIVSYGSLSVLRKCPSKRDMLGLFAGIPWLMMEDDMGRQDIPTLQVDNYGGIRSVVEHLVEHHRYHKVAFLAGPQNNHDSQERLQAYWDVMSEHNIEVTEDMVAFGDFSLQCDQQVEFLLDRNPGLEAIVCADDTMAQCVYRICEKRDLIVGRDIAVTGFDDIDASKSMEPPLSSVTISGFKLSYLAIQDALALIRGERPKYTRMKAPFCRRSSCGCKRSITIGGYSGSPERVQELITERCFEINENLFAAIPYEMEKSEYLSWLEGYFSYIHQSIFEEAGYDFNFSNLMFFLKGLCANDQVSNRHMLEQVVGLLEDLSSLAWTERMRTALSVAVSSTQKYVHAQESRRFRNKLSMDERQTWFLSAFTTDLMSMKMAPKDNMAAIMDRLKKVGVHSTYFYFFEEPEFHSEPTYQVNTTPLYLVAHYNEKEMVAESRDHWQKIGPEGIVATLEADGRHYVSFPLFSGDEHYGLMVCELDTKDIYFVLSICLALGTLFHVLRLDAAEQEAKRQLEEKNSILSFVSEYDELTKLLNRRGFMEKSLELIHANVGRQGYLLFADLDHLKEVNDCFGHAAGDFAICSGGNYLRACLKKDAVIARIGGDEYVAILVEEEDKDFPVTFKNRLDQYVDDFNDQSDKPYYVEISVGIHPFTCTADIELTELLKHSDECLYADKSLRRASIKRVQENK